MGLMGLPAYIPNRPLTLTSTGAKPVRCSLMCRAVPSGEAQLIIVSFEFGPEFAPTLAFFSAECLKPSLHFGVLVNAEATSNEFRHAARGRWRGHESAWCLCEVRKKWLFF
jgi:LSD1 subclass zinc finger protein